MERWKEVRRQREPSENMQVEIEITGKSVKIKFVISLNEFVKEDEYLDESLEGKF